MKRPAFWIAAGLFVATAFCLLFHLFLYWTNLSGLRWPAAHANALLNAGLALLALSGAAIVVGLARLLRGVFRVPWPGAAAWALAGVGSALWPLVALLPAARRLGNRPAARLAARGGAVFLLAPALGAIGQFADAPVFWPLLAVGIVGAWLVLASLRALDGGSRPHRALVRAFALVVLVSLATQPALHAGRVRRQADEDFAALVERIGSPVRPETFRFPPPVAEADDPLAAFDPNAIKADESSRLELVMMLLSSDLDPGDRRHSFAPEELAAAAAWFASHTNLTAAADAMSADPGYRSCLPGPPTLEESARQRFPWFEPRLREALSFAQALVFRARFAREGGADGDAGLDESRRIENLAALYDREPTLLGFILAAALREMESDALHVRIDRWSDDGLSAMQRAAEEAAERIERRFRDAFAGEVFGMRAVALDVWPDALAAASPSLRASRALDYWMAAELRALFRHWSLTWDALDGLLAAAAAEDDFPREAFDRLVADENARAAALPPMAKILACMLTETARNQLAKARDRAAFVRTAVAVERYRRAHGAPPPSLEALVPDFLPAVPVETRSGETFRYEPGPIDVPDETFRVLCDPDEAAARSKAEFRERFGDVETVSVQQIMDAINEELQNESDEAEPDRRTLPAQTFPGFRLTLPNDRDPELDVTYDFITPSEPRAESAE